MMKLETARLIIRSTSEDDLGFLASLWTDPEVTRYLGGPRNYEEVINGLGSDIQFEPQSTFNLWAVIQKDTGQIIGHCGIIEKDIEGKSEYEIIYVFNKNAWHKGFASEAAHSVLKYAINQLGLKRLIALIDPDNLQSRKVAIKIGLKYEKDITRPNGKNMCIFAVNINHEIYQ
jgi:[ribosomal protein S5]-alanine N-acetyltransferase